MRTVCLTLVTLAALTLAAIIVDDGLALTRFRSAVNTDAQSESRQPAPADEPQTAAERLKFLHSQPNDF